MTTTEGNTGTISDTTPKKQSPDIAQNPPTAHISTENTIPSGSGSDTIELGASTSGDSNVCGKQPTLFSEDLTNDLSAIPISEGKTAKAKSVTSKCSYQ